MIAAFLFSKVYHENTGNASTEDFLVLIHSGQKNAGDSEYPNVMIISQILAAGQLVFVYISYFLQLIQVNICLFMQVSVLIPAKYVVLYSQKG